MKSFVLVLLISPIIGFAQSFEGAITYSNTYKSKSLKLKDEQLNSMMGTKQEYFLKEEITNLSLMDRLLKCNCTKVMKIGVIRLQLNPIHCIGKIM